MYFLLLDRFTGRRSWRICRSPWHPLSQGFSQHK